MKRFRKLSLIVTFIFILTVVSGNFSIANAARLGFDNNDIVYMILTDRYPDGDPSNNGILGQEYRPGELKYHQGGDWQGIIDKIPYIKDLGVTAIWISPPSENELFSRDGSESGYHGYFTHDYYSADPHFGTKAKLKELVDTAHANGIKVILDVVPNHTADYLDPYATEYSSADYQPAYPFNNPNWYHHNGDIQDWNDQWQVENCDLGGLDDIAQENTAARNEIKKVYKMWVDDFDIDAVRVDAARSIPKDFLQEFESYLGVPSFGEIFYGDVDYVSDYQNYEWGVLDFPLFFKAREVFAHDASFYDVKNILDQDYKYKDPNKLVTFLDNHDRDRFLCLADDNYAKLRLGMTFLFTVRGIPDVYYGTEQAFYGGGRPTEWQGIANKENREVMNVFDQNNIIYKHIKRLAQIRKDYEPLRNGTQREMWVDDKVFSYSRRNDTTGDEVITILNNDWNIVTRTIPLRTESSIPVGTILTNLLDTSQTVEVTSGGVTGKQITVTIPKNNAMILVPGTPASYIPSAPTVTTIRVHYDVGWGNTMYLRGDTYPLWWDQGRKMRNVAPDIWEFEIERIPAGTTFEFKPLINDTTWSSGNNFIGVGGETIDIYPTF
ncbi:alpha-amylase family glycosyl hydrolase [Petroclostridium xylanilyticum]|jgi:glycosidase|uniref:alpha-amylase family glycosyl hydrolase n=1 Tax=Petroclostridium xylanilyticum TaxID=1792311 RepID=UPI000B98E7BB|nr:alpha-amylase family glycosyl hydrolase [Petroclostridium xylanilyticum]